MKQFLVTVAGVFSGLLLFFVGLPLLFVVIVALATGLTAAANPAASVVTAKPRRERRTESLSPTWITR